MQIILLSSFPYHPSSASQYLPLSLSKKYINSISTWTLIRLLKICMFFSILWTCELWYSCIIEPLILKSSNTTPSDNGSTSCLMYDSPNRGRRYIYTCPHGNDAFFYIFCTFDLKFPHLKSNTYIVTLTLDIGPISSRRLQHRLNIGLTSTRVVLLWCRLYVWFT